MSFQPLQGEAPRLDANIAGDRQGLPNWTTHFGGREFAESSLPGIIGYVEAAYAPGPIDVVSIAGGTAPLERVICRDLQERGYQPQLTVLDLQQASLDQIPPETFPVVTFLANVVEPLPLYPIEPQSGEGGVVVSGRLAISRSWEHYLSRPDLTTALHNIGANLNPGELYAAQLSSGDPVTNGGLSAAVRVLAAKDDRFLSVEQYINIVNDVQYEDGTPVFEVLALGEAEAQTGRGALAQAKRYLNPRFLELHGYNETDECRAEVTHIQALKTRLGAAVHAGTISREDALSQLDEVIIATNVFSLFRDVYVTGVLDYLGAQETAPERGTTIVDDGQGGVEDILLDIEYPIVILRKRPLPDRKVSIAPSIGAISLPETVVG